MIKRYAVTVTTDAGGAATGLTDEVVFGKVNSIRHVADGTNPLASGAWDATITGKTTGTAILTITNGTGSQTWYPRAATADVTGTAALYAGGGSAVLDAIGIGNEQIQIVIAQGGNVKTGVFHVLVES